MGATSHAQSTYRLYSEFISQIESHTGRSFGLHLTEDEFEAMWERIPADDRFVLLSQYRMGFQRLVEESWPRVAAVIDAVRSGHLSADVVARIPRRRRD